MLRSHHEELPVFEGNLRPIPSTIVYRMNIGDYQLPSLETCLLHSENVPNSVSPDIQLPCSEIQNKPSSDSSQNSNQKEVKILEEISHRVAESQDFIHQRYTDDLDRSISAFKQVDHASNNNNTEVIFPTSDSLRAGINTCTHYLQAHVGSFKVAFGMTSNGSMHWLHSANLSPATTIVTLLEFLRSISKTQLKDEVQQQLILLGTAITRLQRYYRILDSLDKCQEMAVRSELKNEGHLNWAPAEYPDWLLFEIDSDLLIREEQADVARAIISPQFGSNSVLQLNMGKGE